MRKNNNNRIRTLPLLLGLLWTCAAACLSIFIPDTSAMYIFGLVWLGLLVYSIIGYFSMMKKYAGMRLREADKLMNDEKAAADKDPEEYCSDAIADIRFYYLYAVSYLFVCTGMLLSIRFPVTVLSVIYIVVSFLTILLILELLIPEKTPKHRGALSREEYPKLYAVADKVYNIGSKPLEPILECGGGASFATIVRGKKIYICIGAYDYSILSDAELEAVLYHESYYNRVLRNSRLRFLVSKNERSSEELNNMLGFVSVLMMYPEQRRNHTLSITRMAAGPAVERKALEYTRVKGLGSEYAAAITKMRMLELFDDVDVEAHINFYENEKIRDNCISLELEEFRKLFARRRDMWIELFEKEESEDDLSFMPFKVLCAGLGTGTPDVSIPDELDEERQRFLEYADGMLVKGAASAYETDRENRYLKPMAIIEKYYADRAEGIEQDMLALRDVMDAFDMLDRLDELEELCRYCIDNSINDHECAHAHFMLGKLLIHRYDTAGLNEIVTAMDTNCNYIREGSEYVDRFSHMLCSARDIDVYKTQVYDIMQRAADRNLLTPVDVSSHDNLEADTGMPAHQQKENLEFIMKTYGSELETVWQIRRELSENFYSTIYILKLAPTMSEQAKQDADKQLFFYLDSQTRQYSFMYLEECSFDPDSIEGARIYPE